MGKGKGSFDHWAARVAVNQIVLELKGMIHEKVARDAFRISGIKLPGQSPPASIHTVAILLTYPPGQYEFVKKGEPPVVGITKLDGVTLAELKRPRKIIAPAKLTSSEEPAATQDTQAPGPSP